jgi:hypothetical protein
MGLGVGRSDGVITCGGSTLGDTPGCLCQWECVCVSVGGLEGRVRTVFFTSLGVNRVWVWVQEGGLVDRAMLFPTGVGGPWCGEILAMTCKASTLGTRPAPCRVGGRKCGACAVGEGVPGSV